VLEHSYLIWIFMFISFILLSILWANNPDYSIDRTKRILLISVFCIYLSFLIVDKKNFNTTLKIFIFSRFIMAMYIIYTLDFSTIGSMRVGAFRPYSHTTY